MLFWGPILCQVVPSYSSCQYIDVRWVEGCNCLVLRDTTEFVVYVCFLFVVMENAARENHCTVYGHSQKFNMKCGHFKNHKIKIFYNFGHNLEISWYKVIKISEMPYHSHINRPMSKKRNLLTYLSWFDAKVTFCYVCICEGKNKLSSCKNASKTC